ncbi:MAG: Asd/ArgC dimerization domain-containing protein [Acidobacteriota bacterium]
MAEKRKFRVALLGTDSLRGKEIKNILSAKRFPLAQIEFFDPGVDEEYSKLTQFQDEPRVIRHPDPAAFDGLDLVFLAADKETNRAYGRLAAKKGFQAIDLSETFSAEADVPLIVAGVNDDLVATKRFALIANPHPVTIILSSLLHRLLSKFGVVKAVAFVLQPVSAFDEPGIEELAGQSTALLQGASPIKKVFQEQIAFNLLSHTETPGADGFSTRERQTIGEIKRVLGLPALPISLSVIQAPVFHTYSIMVYVELGARARIRDLECLYRESPFFKLSSPSASCRVSAVSAAGKELILIGQIKKEESLPNAFWIWTVTDNLTRGSALNALEIARILFSAKTKSRPAP